MERAVLFSPNDLARNRVSNLLLKMRTVRPRKLTSSTNSQSPGTSYTGVILTLKPERCLLLQQLVAKSPLK